MACGAHDHKHLGPTFFGVSGLRFSGSGFLGFKV